MSLVVSQFLLFITPLWLWFFETYYSYYFWLKLLSSSIYGLLKHTMNRFVINISKKKCWIVFLTKKKHLLKIFLRTNNSKFKLVEFIRKFAQILGALVFFRYYSSHQHFFLYEFESSRLIIAINVPHIYKICFLFIYRKQLFC